MDFEHSPRVKELQKRVTAFMDEHIYPNEAAYYAHTRSDKRWEPVPIIEALKPKARKAGLWNLFLPHSKRAPEGLSNLEYAPLCEIMGRVSWAPEVFNCSAPDTGNMETIERYGTEEQKTQWLEPLLRGEIRSAFLMTEPEVASSDATNIQMHIKRDGDDYVINGRKWWSSGAGDPRCKVYIVMGKTNPDSVAPQPAVDDPGPGRYARDHDPASPAVFGYDDAPHGHMEIEFKNVRVPAEHPARRRPRLRDRTRTSRAGRIHHCMRLIGQAERALEKMCKRATQRVAFGRTIAEQGVTRERIAEARIMIDSARFMVLHAAWKMDTVGNKVAQKEIAMIKVLAPNMACQVIDWAMQVHGGGGVTDRYGLANMYAHARTLRFADGPDEVHRNAIAKLEIAEQTSVAEALAGRKPG
jgi:acyl-CoA dehydrogenase